MAVKKNGISPLWLSLSHLLPSILLILVTIVGVLSLIGFEKTSVLGAQTNLPQIKTVTTEERIRELTGIKNGTNSEAVEKAVEGLR